MTSQWYLLRGKSPSTVAPDKLKGASIGPVSAAKLLEMAVAGGAARGDWVWLDGADARMPVERFLALAKAGKLPDSPGKPLPDWMTDVAQSESLAPATPDWLEEVRRNEESSARTRPAKQTTRPVPVELPLDWLEDIRDIEESLRVRPVAKPKPQPPVKSPSAAPPAPPTPARPPSPLPLGHDPATGRILDPVAYQRWQKAEAERRQVELQNNPGLSVAEVFVEAQRALQDWVDAAANKPLVAAGRLEAIRGCSAIEEILRRYEGYGPVMKEKLCKRLALLVDNRQKFFKAFGQTV